MENIFSVLVVLLGISKVIMGVQTLERKTQTMGLQHYDILRCSRLLAAESNLKLGRVFLGDKNIDFSLNIAEFIGIEDKIDCSRWVNKIELHEEVNKDIPQNMPNIVARIPLY